MVPFILAGSWNDANEADREVIAQFTGTSYDQALALASAWLVRPEAPFRRTGTTWHLLSREDAWVHLAPRLTRPMLEGFVRLATGVLAEDDPRFDLSPDQRMFASIHGKVPKHSGTLKEGLAETLALLGAELVPLPGIPNSSGAEYARKVVRDLLPAGASARRWFTLGPILGLMAEAAPEDFLTAVERDLAGAPPAILALFAGDDGGVFGSGSRHHYLMWALNALAWHPAFLARTALVLARLAAMDPGGKTSPRPASSLNDIFRLWYPQTAAAAIGRFEVIDLLIERLPVEAWKLLIKLLPKGHDAASPTYPPRWREWPSQKRPNVSDAEHREQAQWTAERLLKLALLEPARRLELTGHIDHLPDREFTSLVEHLRGLDASVPAADRLALWTTVHDLIRKHEYFDTADWRMSEERLTTLRQAEAHLRPTDPAARGRWLFAQHHLYMGTHKTTPHEQQEAMALEMRRQLLAEILAHGGVAAAADFAASLQFPGLVGDIIGRTGLCPEWEQILPGYLVSDKTGGVIFARCYAAALFAVRGWDWVDTLPLAHWDRQAIAELLLALPCVPRAWELAANLGNEVETAYWKAVHPFMRDLDEAASAQALRRLLQANRPLIAADCVSMVYHNKRRLPPDLLAEVLDRSVAALNEAGIAGHDVSMVIYDLEQTLQFLQDDPAADPVRVAQLEWTYLPVLRDGTASPKFLHRELARDPAFFAQCIELVGQKDQPDGEQAPQAQETKARSKLARELLDSWSGHPALLVDGGPDEPALRAWVDDVRRRCETLGRLKACDYHLGCMLAAGPAAPDGSWPSIAVRNVLESIPGDIVLDAFHGGIFDGRGVTSRGMHDGGEQERNLAKKYHGYADACQLRWPRVSATLRDLAIHYESDARYMDDRADDHA